MRKKKVLLGCKTNLTVLFGLGPLWSSDAIANIDLLQETKAFRLGEKRGLTLAEVELNRTVVAEDVREEWLSLQLILTDFESCSQILSILGVGNFHFFSIKVLPNKHSNYDVLHCGQKYTDTPHLLNISFTMLRTKHVFETLKYYKTIYI